MRRFGAALHQAAIDEIVVRLEAAAPFKTGATVKGIKASAGSGGDVFSAEVTSETPQGEYVEFGTREHTIVPVRASVLRFEAGGSVVYARHATILARAARPWFAPTVAQWGSVLERLAPGIAA